MTRELPPKGAECDLTTAVALAPGALWMARQAMASLMKEFGSYPGHPR